MNTRQIPASARCSAGLHIAKTRSASVSLVVFFLLGAFSANAVSGQYPNFCFQSAHAGAFAYCVHGAANGPFYWLGDTRNPGFSGPKGAYQWNIDRINDSAQKPIASAIPEQCEWDSVFFSYGVIGGVMTSALHTPLCLFDYASAPPQQMKGWVLAAAYCPTGWSIAAGATRSGLPAVCSLGASTSPSPKSFGPPSNPSCSNPPKANPVAGNPINIATGNKFQVETDYSPRTTPALDFRRYYNGTGNFPSINLGRNWRSEYDRVIESDSPGFAQIHRHDGKIYLYKQGVSGWVSDPDVPDRLSEIRDGSGARIGWRYFTASNGIEIYDATGRLHSLVDSQGNQLALIYSGSLQPGGNAAPAPGPLVEIRDQYGRALRFEYDAGARLNAIIDFGGNRIVYTYDASENLSAATHADNRTTRYHYENAAFPSALTGITDTAGVRFATYRYNSTGQAIGSEHAGGADAHILSFGSNSATVTDPLGTSRIYNFLTIHGISHLTAVSQPGGSGCGPAASALTYDANGNIASRTDFNGAVTTYQYDLTRNLETSRTEAAGTPEARTIATTWHPYWRQPVSVSEPGRSTTWVYNGDNGTLCAPATATVPSINGGTQPIGVVCEKTVQSGGDTHTWRWTYNEHGRPLTENGPRTDVADLTTHSYWPIDATCPGSGTGVDKGCRGQLQQTTNALGHVTRYTRYNAHGQPEEIIDPNGIATTIAYDLRQRPMSVSVGGETTTYTYDAVGQLTRLSLPDGNTLTYTWDDAHRLTGISDAAGNRIAYTLDAAGNRIGEDTFDGSGQLTRAITRSIDALGRVQAVSGIPFVQP